MTVMTGIAIALAIGLAAAVYALYEELKVHKTYAREFELHEKSHQERIALIQELLKVNEMQHLAIAKATDAIKTYEGCCKTYRATIASLQEENDQLMMLKNAVESLANLGENKEIN